MALSPREQRILAAIEDELGEKDPVLVATFARARLPSAVLQRFPLPLRHVCLLLLALLALIVLHSLGLELGLAESAILTVGLIVPWIVIAARANSGAATLRECRRRALIGPDLTPRKSIR